MKPANVRVTISLGIKFVRVVKLHFSCHVSTILTPRPPNSLRRHSTAHSHSIIFVHDNALKFRRKFFQYTLKHRAHDPSEICALDFKENFRRFAIWSISPTIGIDWSIF
jgi:hypothetical protein